MKIIIVNTSDIDGGAARAAYRLHKSLLAQNIDSQMLVQDKKSDDFTVHKVSSTKIQRWSSKVIPAFDGLPVRLYRDRSKTFFSPSLFGLNNIVNIINDIKPDIVHLHWICGGMIKIEDIAKIKAPLVWSLHDMWMFTGGCHYDDGCGAYKKSCGHCKVLGSNKNNDLSKKIYKRKQKMFSKMNNLTIIGLSKWLNECSKSSSLVKGKHHVNLPNPINTENYKPFDKEKSRQLWNLPADSKLILFGAVGATSDPRKGFKELSEALHKLTANIEFVVFGSSEPEESQNFGFKTHYLGHLHDDVSLVTLYSAVDLMVVPSLQENLSNAIMESLACATPVVSFDIGGNSDMVDHKKNGYLAKPYDTSDLAYGMEWVLDNKNYNILCQNAREKVLREFDSIVIAKKYINLYEKIING